MNKLFAALMATALIATPALARPTLNNIDTDQTRTDIIQSFGKDQSWKGEVVKSWRVRPELAGTKIVIEYDTTDRIHKVRAADETHANAMLAGLKARYGEATVTTTGERVFLGEQRMCNFCMTVPVFHDTRRTVYTWQDGDVTVTFRMEVDNITEGADGGEWSVEFEVPSRKPIQPAAIL